MKINEITIAEPTTSLEAMVSGVLALILAPKKVWAPRAKCSRCNMNTTRVHSSFGFACCTRCEDLPSEDVVLYVRGSAGSAAKDHGDLGAAFSA
jgi:hypothetical protein